jgi:hypothetical protein
MHQPAQSCGNGVDTESGAHSVQVVQGRDVGVAPVAIPVHFPLLSGEVASRAAARLSSLPSYRLPRAFMLPILNLCSTHHDRARRGTIRRILRYSTDLVMLWPASPSVCGTTRRPAARRPAKGFRKKAVCGLLRGTLERLRVLRARATSASHRHLFDGRRLVARAGFEPATFGLCSKVGSLNGCT